MAAQKIENVRVAQLRSALSWSRNQLAHVMNASDRAIVNWEAGDPINPVYAAKLREIQSVYNELKQLMKPEEIGPWLLTEMEEFEGRTPADLINKGETGRFLGIVVLSPFWNAGLIETGQVLHRLR
ncbi:MAG: hypothetical protein L0Y58_17745 [Verrucomicrobia subdivision 3 bacterium]|nr:hypothetical protein [Limisphaerales bacterium]